MIPSPSPSVRRSIPPPPPLARISTSSQSSKDSTLSLINKEFQDSVGRYLVSSLPDSSSVIVLCDFPSRLYLPEIHCQIFGLDDFAFFHQAVLNRHDEEVIVITQHSLSLRKILLPHDSHSLKLCFYTRTASVLPYELKIIEILHSLPNHSFQKTESLKYLKSFRVELQNQKGKYHKAFDLFELRQDTSNTFSVLEIINAPCTLHSIYFCENPDLMSQASVHLATHAVPHTYTNPLQIKVPKGTQIITSSFEFLEHNSLDHIIDLLESPCYTNLFVFKAIAASHSSLPEHSQFNFLKITRLDPEPLITLFTQANIHYLLLTHFLLFQASPIQIEKLILSAQELDVCIPPSFVTVTKKISFEKSGDKIYARILLATQTAFHELQIQREDIGSTSDIFWTPDFLKYLNFRFLCQNQPQIKTVKSHQGIIKEVLAFTAPSSLLDTIPTDQIPFTFQFEGHTFMLSFLEPLFFTSPISITPYPFETQIEHFKRFNGQTDSNSIRIPILIPHSTKGGPRAQDILNTLSFRLLPECDPPIHYIYSESSKYFYLFLVSQDSIWIENLNLLFPQKQLKTVEIPVLSITYHTPHFVLLKTFSDTTFPIPFIDNPTCKFLNQGWISATSFGSCFLLLLLPSLAIIDSIRQFIMHHDEHFEQSIIIGFFPAEEHILDQNDETDIALPSATVVDMDIASPLTVHDLPVFSPLLLISYRLLAYFTWNRTFSHVRQRLLEAVSGGLHSSSPAILPILTQCIDTFDPRTFTPLPSFTQTFMQLCLGLPEDLQKELFPTLLTPTKRSSSPIIYLESFPLVTSSEQLCHEFKRIFDYLPESSKLIFSQPSLIFCCSTFSNMQKSHFLELFLAKIPTTEESKANTSEPTRPIVLRLAALMLEPINPLNPITSPPLIIESYHEDHLCVTVYDPTAGVRSVPLSDLLNYQVIGVHFKRSSTVQLICPKLLQRFAALPIPKAINTSHSKFSIISLFDGSGSFVDVISQALEAWPHAILAAENDPGTRSIVAKVKGWPLDGTLWAYDKRGAHSFYAKDVWALIQNHCLILKQFLSLLPEDSVIFLAAGFPCPDLTVIGRGNGLLGLAGDRSVLIHCGWAVLYYLSLTPWWHKVIVLFENAGSMKEHMKTYIHELLGIPIKCAHYINCSTWGSVSRARYFFASSDIIVLPTGSSSPFDDGWLPALHPTKLTPRPLPPWLRPRAITDMGNVVQTPLAYHPKSLLYDINYFSGLPGFQQACITHASKLYPKLPFLDFLPPFLWDDWNTLESWPADFTVELTPAILKTVSRLQDFYSNPHIYLPFRLPSLSEKAKDSELSELLLATIEEASPPLFTLHNIIGNFFKPSAVVAALGGPMGIRSFVSGHLSPHLWCPASPTRVESNFQTLRSRVLEDTSDKSHLHSHIALRWFPKNIGDLSSDDFWFTSRNSPLPHVQTADSSPLPLSPPKKDCILPSPLSTGVTAHLHSFPALVPLLQHNIYHTYPLDVILSSPIPPFPHVQLPIFLTPSMLQKLSFLQAYFVGWELRVARTAALVLYENTGDIFFRAYGTLHDFDRLYLFVFSADSNTFQYSLLLQLVCPPPSLPSLLTNLSTVWSLPLYLNSYRDLQARYPSLLLFDSIASTILDCTIYQPWGNYFTPLQLTTSTLPFWIATLFDPQEDDPMWTLSEFPTFTGYFPFMVHVQFWLFVHRCYQDAFSFHPSPFVYIHRFPPGASTPDESFYFCLEMAPPSIESRSSQKCPHIILRESRSDIMHQFYGIVIDRAGDFSATLDVAAHEAKFLRYP